MHTQFDYAPSLESTDVVKIQKKNKLFINGKFVSPTSDKYFPSTNPATGKILAEIAEASAKDVDVAVKSARKAYSTVW